VFQEEMVDEDKKLMDQNGMLFWQLMLVEGRRKREVRRDVQELYA
jgi:hypothetical protein